MFCFYSRLAVIQRWRHPPKDPLLFEDPSDFEIWGGGGAMPSLLDERMATQITAQLNQRGDGVYRVWLAPIL